MELEGSEIPHTIVFVGEAGFNQGQEMCRNITGRWMWEANVGEQYHYVCCNI